MYIDVVVAAAACSACAPERRERSEERGVRGAQDTRASPSCGGGGAPALWLCTAGRLAREAPQSSAQRPEPPLSSGSVRFWSLLIYFMRYGVLHVRFVAVRIALFADKKKQKRTSLLVRCVSETRVQHSQRNARDTFRRRRIVDLHRPRRHPIGLPIWPIGVMPCPHAERRRDAILRPPTTIQQVNISRDGLRVLTSRALAWGQR